MSLRQGKETLAKPAGMAKTIGSGVVRDSVAKGRYAEYGTWTTTVQARSPAFSSTFPEQGQQRSPLFSRKTHRVIGLQTSSTARRVSNEQSNRWQWGSGAVPMRMILEDLARQLATAGR